MNITSLFKSFLSIFLIKIYTNLYTLIIISLVIYWYHTTLETKDSVNSNQNEIVKHIDSITAQNKILISKIDSLDLNKKEKLTVYHKTTTKYDTIKIIIDSMPPLDATLFLLSKSRQLTDKGIE